MWLGLEVSIGIRLWLPWVGVRHSVRVGLGLDGVRVGIKDRVIDRVGVRWAGVRTELNFCYARTRWVGLERGFHDSFAFAFAQELQK